LTVRYVIRPPSMKTTPLRLKELFSAQGMYRWPSRRVLPRYTEDFILSYHSPELWEDFHALNREEQSRLRDIERLYRSSKSTQRSTLSSTFPTPKTFTVSTIPREQPPTSPSGRWVVRPLRHHAGLHFRITEDPYDFTPEEYISEFYPKNREYRVILVKGHPVATLYKSTPPGTANDIPWNHSVSTFKTVRTFSNSFLSTTDFLSHLSACDFLKYVHLCALDILCDTRNHTRPYVLCEINFAPALSIENTLNGVRDAFYR
jgi:hypothetical protein